MELFAYSWSVASEDTTSIRIYGIMDNSSACLRIENFTPFVYVEILSETVVDKLESIIRQNLKEYFVDSTLIKKERLYHQNSKNSNLFLFVQSLNKKHLMYLVYKLRKGVFIDGKLTCFKVFETAASPILQMTTIRDLPMAGWIKFTKYKIPPEVHTNCKYEFIVSWKHLFKSDSKVQVVPKVIAFDIETNSTNVDQMPQDKPGDKIFQISCVSFDNNERHKTLFTVCDVDDSLSRLKDVTVFKFCQQELAENDYNLLIDEQKRLDAGDARYQEIDRLLLQTKDEEEQLLIAFLQFIDKESPHVLTGYNIFGFDIEYIMKRCCRYYLDTLLKSIGKYKNESAAVKTINWSSSAFKNQIFKFIDWEGILLLDCLPICRRDYKLDTYTLQNVANTFLHVGKDPVTYKDVFNAFRDRTNLDFIGKYCIQDSNLCIDLLNHWQTWIAYIEMSKVCHVPIFVLYTQGQQIKLFSQVYKYCFKHNIVVDDPDENCFIERYRGASVIEPECGFYQNVVPLDFSSLYPSIIIAYNICYSTLAPDSALDSQCTVFSWEDHVGCEHDEKNISIRRLTREIDAIGAAIKELRRIRDLTKNVSQRAEIQKQIEGKILLQKPLREARQKNKTTLSYEEDGQKYSGIICAKRHFRFLKPSVKKGVVPTIIQNLLDSRLRVKNEMSTASPEEKTVLDKQQLAYKVSANSMYGAMGVKKGYLPFMIGAMCVTFVGREAIAKTKNIISSKWNGRVVAGDTDSNYVVFNIANVRDLWNHAVHVAEDISLQFPPPIKLEFEQTIYSKFLILSKKRYMYQEISKDGIVKPTIGKKGVLLARRDHSKVSKNIYEKIVEMIFNGANKQDLFMAVEQYIQDIYRDKLNHRDYVITKSVGYFEEDDEGGMGDYKIRSLPENDALRLKMLKGMSEHEWKISCMPAQIQLAERMRLRNTPISVGSRLEYVVLRGVGKLGDKIEEYDYFTRHRNLKLDPNYYVKSLINPLDQIFDVLYKEHFVKDLYSRYLEYYKEKERLEKPKIIIIE